MISGLAGLDLLLDSLHQVVRVGIDELARLPRLRHVLDKLARELGFFALTPAVLLDAAGSDSPSTARKSFT
jgi:hypothetical protein